MAITTTVITGATSGIGEAVAFALAKKDHALYLLVRNVQKGEEVKQRVVKETGNQDIHIIYCDLTDLATIVAAAEQLKSKLFNVQVLINNAGGMFNKFKLTKDGFETTFQLNHLGHFLLTERLMPLLEKGHARIINVSSAMHKTGKLDVEHINDRQRYAATKAYSNSKLFNIYFTKSLAGRYASKGITAFALHPGVVKTNFNTKLSGGLKFFFSLATPFMISAEKGAQTIVYLATAQKLQSKSGGYFVKQKAVRPAKIANDEAAREKLWSLSDNMVAKFNT
ncbi:SDR family oxidoreductase [Mucilaginibacter panaciglaebae]|uniref:SDR family oxidoreductase n=1 Tax=Mucilaginibacter panaciglaebae TaxID=502331 RepID=A0ABP7WBM4_9SPHI